MYTCGTNNKKRYSKLLCPITGLFDSKQFFPVREAFWKSYLFVGKECKQSQGFGGKQTYWVK